MQSTITMLAAPQAMRGRMMGLLSVCIGASTPIGTLAMGFMATTATIQAAIALSAVGGLLLCVPAIVWTPLLWQRLTSPPVRSASVDKPSDACHDGGDPEAHV